MRVEYPPEADSIFGVTGQGVSNPMVPHKHPYPTRYHGPRYGYPDVANIPYAARFYKIPPYAGFGRSGFGVGVSPGEATTKGECEALCDAHYVGARIDACKFTHCKDKPLVLYGPGPSPSYPAPAPAPAPVATPSPDGQIVAGPSFLEENWILVAAGVALIGAGAFYFYKKKK